MNFSEIWNYHSILYTSLDTHANFRGDRRWHGRDLRGGSNWPPPPPSKNLVWNSPVKIGLKCLFKLSIQQVAFYNGLSKYMNIHLSVCFTYISRTSGSTSWSNILWMCWFLFSQKHETNQPLVKTTISLYSLLSLVRYYQWMYIWWPLNCSMITLIKEWLFISLQLKWW